MAGNKAVSDLSQLVYPDPEMPAPDSVLEELHTLATATLRHALGAKPGTGMTAKGWNVMLPVAVVERCFEGF